MNIRPRLDALEAKCKPDSLGLVICSAPEEAQRIDTPTTVIITGVPRPPRDTAI